MKKSLLLASACLAITTTSFVTMDIARPDKKIKESAVSSVQVSEEDEKGEPLTFRINLDNVESNQIQIEVYGSSVHVMGHDADEVVIETRSYDLPERAAGLRSLFSQVEDNTKLGMSVLKEDNTLRIIQANRQEGEYTIKVPKNVRVVYHEENPHGGDFKLTDTAGEIDIELLHGNATLTNITGPVKASTVHGNIDIIFTQLNQAKASTINSVHGPIDITLPVNTSADFELSANHGEIYTDFDIIRATDNKGGLTKIAGGETIQGKTNDGGVAMNISTVHSDIYIRKSK